MKKIEVFVWSAINGLPSSSPFCLKVITALRYKQIEHQITVVDRPPSWLKRGKLPAIKIDDQIVEDSTNILKLLDELAPSRALLYPNEEKKRAEEAERLRLEEERLAILRAHEAEKERKKKIEA
jgi:glutathione S-transferase